MKKSLPSRFTKNCYSSHLEMTVFVKTSYKISNYLLIAIFQWTNIKNLYMISKEQYFSCYILLSDQISLSGLTLLLEILCNLYIVTTCFSICKMIEILKLNLAFLSGPFPTKPKSEQKFKYHQNESSF